MERGISVDKKPRAGKGTFEKPVNISMEDIQGGKLDKLFKGAEDIKFDVPIPQNKRSAVEEMYAKYPEIKDIIESGGDATIEVDVDEFVAEELTARDIKQRMDEKHDRRKMIAERNIRNFIAVVNKVARNEMLDPKHVNAVVNAKVAELSDETNALAGMMENPRIILDQIVPEAIEQIKALEEADGHNTH